MGGIMHQKKKQSLVNEKLSSESSQPETYNELLPKLSLAMRKIINDLPISESFLDNGSEFDGFNLATAEELGWKVDKPSKFAVKGNSEHISEALGWYINVAVTLKDMKGNPIITIIGNYAYVDNEDHGKTYIIPTFSKAPVVKDPPKEEQDQTSTNSSNLTGEKDLKKSA
uniref:Uncharacterized protein n=1 Tax=Rhizophagus irregularis (strain DAOM 181602 / DAOM 197198 / MUCL 43194) TaxID=747089 RepID=U9T2U6_RHIID